MLGLSCLTPVLLCLYLLEPGRWIRFSSGREHKREEKKTKGKEHVGFVCNEFTIIMFHAGVFKNRYIFSSNKHESVSLSIASAPYTYY